MLRIDIDKRVGDFHLRPKFEAGNELVVLFGPSGCGKSLTLQAIAGLLTPDAGRIEMPGGTIAFDAAARINLPPQARSTGYVVQELALFPHMTVAENIAFGVRASGREARDTAVADMVQLTGLVGLEGRRPRQLSGGQQQRVALARALACRPGILLLDEPFSALDSAVRAELRDAIVSLHASRGIPMLIVTHDLADAFSLGSRIIVIEGGRVLQQGSREDVFYRPAERRVAELVGTRNILAMTVSGLGEGIIHLDWAGRPIVASIYPTHEAPPLARGQGVQVSIRPSQIMIRRPGDSYAGRANVFNARITDEIIGADTYRLSVAIAEAPSQADLQIELPAYTYFRLGLDRDKNIEVSIRPEAVHIMHADAPRPELEQG